MHQVLGQSTRTQHQSSAAADLTAHWVLLSQGGRHRGRRARRRRRHDGRAARAHCVQAGRRIHFEQGARPARAQNPAALRATSAVPARCAREARHESAHGETGCWDACGRSHSSQLGEHCLDAIVVCHVSELRSQVKSVSIMKPPSATKNITVDLGRHGSLTHRPSLSLSGEASAETLSKAASMASM